jgi:hypothetical protein
MIPPKDIKKVLDKGSVLHPIPKLMKRKAIQHFDFIGKEVSGYTKITKKLTKSEVNPLE